MFEYVTKNVKYSYVQEFLDKFAENGYRLVTAIPVELYGEKYIMLFFERPVQK
jgi:hypothetical protein